MRPPLLSIVPPGAMRADGYSAPPGLEPATIRHAYGIDQVTFSNGTVAGTGVGQTIAIVDAFDDPNIAADLDAFDQAFSIDGGGDTLYQQYGASSSFFTKLNQDGQPSPLPAPTDSGWGWEISLDVEWAHVIAPAAHIVLLEASDLYAAVDTAKTLPDVSIVSMSWGSAESPGETNSDGLFTTPSGHTGITFLASTGDDGTPALYPANSPNVVAVGGTSLVVDGGDNYVSESGWSGSGGGISTIESEPSYQHGVVSQSDSYRTTPDISFDGSTGVAVYNSYFGGATTPWGDIAGTSFSAPAWAGLIALANQGRALYGMPTLDGPTQTLPRLYALPSSDFHDITTGNNGYAAGPGYDLVTGRGTPVANVLVGELADVPGDFVVTNTNDSGFGSLRQAILDANAYPGRDTISFDIIGFGAHTIEPLSPLPEITDSVVLDATTQPEYGGLPAPIVLDGDQAGTASGLIVDAPDSTVRGLVTQHFQGDGIDLIASGGGDAVVGDYIGIDSSGSQAASNTGDGILIENSPNNTIGGSAVADRCIVSANGIHGIEIGGPNSTDNLVMGDYIGTDVAGSTPLGNAQDGVYIDAGANGNRVGADGDDSDAGAEGNVISGNGHDGVGLEGAGTDNNWVAGNLIGTDATGLVALGGNHFGVRIGSGASSNTIGTNADGVGDQSETNVLAGNLWDGVIITGAGTDDNVVAGNLIGADATGEAALGNNFGVRIDSGAADNRIGTNGDGTNDAAESNVISGNRYSGVFLTDAGTNGNIVAGNLIGTDAAGTSLLANAEAGVLIQNGAQSNRIGADGADADPEAEGNVISGSGWDGIDISGAGNDYNWISGNLIGTDKTGTVALGGNHYGVRIDSGASDNIIGTDGDGNGDAFERNVISGNQLSGVYLTDAGTTGNTVAGNLIGTDVTGTTPVPNAGDGITLNIASGNTIGGDAVADRNVISGNGQSGINSSTATNVIVGNYIGTDVTGNGLGQGAVAWYKGEGNTDDAINHLQGTLQGSAGYTKGEVGQALAFGGGSDGMVVGSSATGPLDITGNAITVEAWVFQTSASQTDNPWGIQAIAAKWYGTAAEGYLLQTVNGHLDLGIVTSAGRIDALASTTLPLNTWVHVAGTYDGQAVQVYQNGALLASAAQTGDILHSDFNFAVGNFPWGNYGWKGDIDELTVYNRALNPQELAAIVSDGSAGKPNFMGNRSDGVGLYNSTNNTIGGAEPADRNVISGNLGNGIKVDGASSTSNLIMGNSIGTDASGTAAVGNGFSGVFIDNGATNNRVGADGADAGAATEGNLISGNGDAGVLIYGAGSEDNVVAGNLIGTDESGEFALGNTVEGVSVYLASNNRVGTNGDGKGDADERNVISGNDNVGVYLALDSGNVVAGNYIGTDARGEAKLGNMDGVFIADGTESRVGVDEADTDPQAEGNLISGNAFNGVGIDGDQAENNVVAGNLVGTDKSGEAALDNGWGVVVSGGANNNHIGTDGDRIGDVAERNVISGNTTTGILIYGSNGKDSSDNVVAGNYIGTDETGTAALANGEYGVSIESGATNNRVGVDGADAGAAAEANVISGNGYGGVVISDAGTNGNWVAGNLIGTDKTGDAALPNVGSGVLVSSGASDNVIGSNLDSVGDAAEANVISGNRGDGIAISGTGTSGNVVAKNLIGPAANGVDALGNFGGVGIISSASGNFIGDPTDAGGNQIAFNTGAGVDVFSGNDNRLTGNSIHDNGGLGIDLGGDGVTPNHPGGSTTGPNNWQNYPIINTASYDGATLSLAGTLNSTPSSSFVIDFYASPHADPSDYGQGEWLLTSLNVTTDVSGNASFSTAFSAALSYSDVITAIATDANGNTSEFSQIATLVNHAPSFTASDPPATMEGSGEQTVSDWAAFNPGQGSNESGQTATYTVSNINNAALFAVAPLVAPDGTLTYTPAAGEHGSSTFEVQVEDSGGTANGGVDTSATQAFTITVDAPATVTSADSATFVVGSFGSFQFSAAGFPAPTMTFSGPLPTGLTFDGATDTLSGTPAFGSVATYPLTVTAHNGAGGDDTQNFTLTVTRATPVITWSNPADITYGDKLSATQLDATANVAGSFSYTLADHTTAANGAALNAAQGQLLDVAFTPADPTDYIPTTAQVKINVDSAPLTIRANDQTMIYGGTLPALTVSYSGLVNGDTPATFGVSPNTAPTVTAPATKHVGSYAGAIVASGAADADYTISYVAGKLTVTAAALTITANDQTMVYGGALPALTVSYSGLVNGDTPATFSSKNTAPTLSAPATNHVGSYSGAIVAAGAADGDYTISYVPGNLTVTAAALTITANDQTMIYGGTLPALTVSYSGLVNGDLPATFSDSPNRAPTVTAPATNHVGSYSGAIVAAGAADGDYTISYVPGKLTVTAAALTITANDQTMAYGGTLPALTVSYSGLVNGDTPATFSSSPNVAPTVTASATNHVGSYAGAIVASGAVDADYTITYVAGKLTVTAAALTITANDQTMVYGGALPALTVSYSGLVNGDTPARFGGGPNTAPTVTAPATNHVGSYAGAIVASGAADADYTISYVAGKLTVTLAALTITADDQTMVYGGALPALTVTYNGLVNGDTPATFSSSPNTAPTVSAPATNHVGNYAGAIVASGAADADYTITYVAGKLTVAPAALTVTANDQTMVYGGALPTLTVSYSGLVNGDTPTTFGVRPNTAPTLIAPAKDHVGSYDGVIVASGAVDADYTIIYVPGKLTITPAALTITANNQTMVYGGALPTLTVSYNGLVNGDMPATFSSRPNTAPTVSAPATNHVGSYAGAIVAGGAADADYTINYVAGKLTVTPAALTIAADDKNKVYGAALPALTASYSGFVKGDTAASLTVPPTLSTTATAGSQVSGHAYAIAAGGAVDADYTISYVPGTLTVTPATLTVAADDKTRVYGSANPLLTDTISGFVNSDPSSVVSGAAGLSTTATSASGVGDYAIAVGSGTLAAANYTFAFSNGTLKVTPATLTVTADDKAKVYGSANPMLTATITGFVNSDTAASLTTLPTLSTTATASNHVSGGPYAITAGGAVDADYTISYVAGTLTVTPVPLAITADDKSKVYGAALPALTASYSGFVSGDTAANLTTQPTLSTTATASSHVAGSPYTITAGGAVDADYAISYVAGTLTVTPAPLTITADDQSKVYGAALPTLTASYSGFVNGDRAASLTAPPVLSTTATVASHVSGGPYTITASDAVDTDYTIRYVAGTLNVTPAALTITADDQSKVYGAALPALTASYSGFVNGDTAATLTTAPSLSTTATSGSHVSGSPYTIIASGPADADYAISYVPGSLTVMPVPLTITADDQSKVYGAALPTLTASYSGFVNGDTAASLTTQPTLSTTATAGSRVAGSPYSITTSGAADPDYTITNVAGTLTVPPTPLTITADDKSKVYGAALSTLTASYSGFVNGDTAASLTTQPTLSTMATASSPVAGSSYSIAASGAVDADYTIRYVPGTLTVTPTPLIITADNKSKVYGAALPALTASYSGFVNGDTAVSLTTPPTLTTTASADSHVSGGPYTIAAGGAADPDYTISYVAGTLTVTPAPLAITADDKSKVYGAALPTLTASYSGFVNGDTAAGLTTQPTLSTTATAGSHVSGSPYTITSSGAVDSDYSISYVPGALTVTPATLTVTANDASKVQGAPNPTFTDTITGFVNGDTSGVISGAASLSTTATAASGVGSYPITAAQGTMSGADYSFAFQNGTLMVTASTPFVVYGAVYTIGSGAISISAENGLLDNDTGPSQLTVAAGTVAGAQGGTFVLNSDGSFTYTPGANFPGYDSAPFTVTDASGGKATQTVTVLSQHASVVWKFYESVLNRTPDPAGLQYWTNYFNGGGQTGQMAVGFFESSELLDKIINNYYQQYLLRTPDDAGLSFWVSQWQATGEPEGIKAGFADSPEFYNSAGGTPGSWLTQLYQRILDRAPDAAGYQFWLNYYQQQLAAGVPAGSIQQTIALGFFTAAEAYGDDVTGWFNEYLGRNPTSSEQSQYVSQMEAGATDRTIEQEITNLPEYASSPPAPGDGTASPLPDYYQTAPATAQSQAAVAAKDALFSLL